MKSSKICIFIKLIKPKVYICTSRFEQIYENVKIAAFHSFSSKTIRSGILQGKQVKIFEIVRFVHRKNFYEV